MSYGSRTWSGTLVAMFLDRDKEPVEWEVSVELDCTSPSDPGKLSGPPEDCYPPESAEFEWTEVHIFVGPHTIMKSKSYKALELLLGSAVLDHVLEEANDDAHENFEQEEPDGDYLYEQQRDREDEA